MTMIGDSTTRRRPASGPDTTSSRHLRMRSASSAPARFATQVPVDIFSSSPALLIVRRLYPRQRWENCRRWYAAPGRQSGGSATRFRGLPCGRDRCTPAHAMKLRLITSLFLCAGGPGDLGPGNDHLGSGGAGGGGPIDPNGPDAATWEGDPVSCMHAQQTHTYVGCDFWPTVQPNVVKSYFDYAV